MGRLGFRTKAMYKSIDRDSGGNTRQPQSRADWLRSRGWQRQQNHWAKTVRPGEHPPEAHAITAHGDSEERARGNRLAWIFLLPLLIPLCLWLAFIPHDALTCAVGVC